MFYKLSFCLFCALPLLLGGCSDFYKKDFIHISSAHNLHGGQKSQKEREIQAMRKSQIMQDNQSRLVMIARYVNDYSSDLAKELSAFATRDETDTSDKGEVFLIEIYDKHDALRAQELRFRLYNAFDSVESKHIRKLSHSELSRIAQFVPDITYNDIYLVLFDPISVRGRETLKLEAKVKNLGSMSFDYGYIVRKSKLVTQ